MTDLSQATLMLQKFVQGSLKTQISQIEKSLSQKNRDSLSKIYEQLDLKEDLLDAALSIKKLAAQINEVIHAVGILLLLDHILEEGELIESLSLAAGNTSKEFDLETNLRIAEFKFIHWRGGSESIRQNALFKDFYSLAKSSKAKRKYLYVIDDTYPLKFLRGGRALRSVMSKEVKLWTEFQADHKGRFQTVGDYYREYSDSVAIVDVKNMINNFDELIAENLLNKD